MGDTIAENPVTSVTSAVSSHMFAATSLLHCQVSASAPAPMFLMIYVSK
jgi:hypothetical protein